MKTAFFYAQELETRNVSQNQITALLKLLGKNK